MRALAIGTLLAGLDQSVKRFACALIGEFVVKQIARAIIGGDDAKQLKSKLFTINLGGEFAGVDGHLHTARDFVIHVLHMLV